MEGSIRLTAGEHKVLLAHVRRGTDPQVRLRCHIVLLLAAGCPWSQIESVLFTSSRTISRWSRRFRSERMDGLLGNRARKRRLTGWYLAIILKWVTEESPSEFGFLRSRWSCETVVVLLEERFNVNVSPESVRRTLRDEGLVWRRPRPRLGPKDPDYDEKLGAIQALIENLPDDETVVFQDEVDVHLNPKIGSMWMRRGEQAEVVTPGNNVKRHLAGSLHWRTGRLILSAPSGRRNSQLFVDHLRHLGNALRRFRTIHVVCDNARFHDCRAVREFLQQSRVPIQLHFLPCYAPETNPIERVWWHLHENVTRNHRCQTIDELIGQVFQWVQQKRTFEIESSFYAQKPKQLAASTGHFPRFVELFRTEPGNSSARANRSRTTVSAP